MIAIEPNRPRPEHGLHYDTPAMVWDEALPLGNGILGGLVWGDGHPLKITLDRTDLWDLREIPEYNAPDFSFAQMRRMHQEGRHEDLVRLFEKPYSRPGPTKLPGGRIEIDMPDGAEFESAELDIANAIATVRFRERGGAQTSSGSRAIEVRITAHAKFPVGLISVRGGHPKDVRLISPFGANSGISADTISALGYPAPAETSSGNLRTYVQETEGGASFAAAIGWSGRTGEWDGAWSIACTSEHRDPLRVARLMVTNALRAGFATDTSRKWWDGFWARSSVMLPNKLLERQWYLEMYKLGAASRRGCPPITLQGPWTADGELPPWKGDYHHDMNTQLTYSAHFAANHLDEGLSFVDWLWNTRGNCADYTKRFYGLPGMNVPMTADLSNSQMGGWRQYAFSSTTAAWLAHQFYQHWQYSRDRRFLRDRAYPYLREAAIFIEAMTAQRDSDGKRTLPLSSSPEINDNGPEAWFDSITNYDLALCRWLLSASAEMASELKKREDAARWRRALSEMPEFAYGDDGGLLVAKAYPMHSSHRHFSHLLAIFPLQTIRWDDGDRARRTIRATLAELERLGTAWWCGYSFSWIAAVYALARDGEKAEANLEIFAKAFCLRNSFHCNGDQSGKGYSKMTYRPFTLEGNLVAATAIQNMLLQSGGGRIRVFPAVPDNWKDVSFTTLRAEGAFLVSARRVHGQTEQVEIMSETGGLCTLVSPWTGRDVNIGMRKGERVTLTQDHEERL